MMGIRDSTVVSPSCTPGYDVGPIWLEGHEWSSESWWGSPNRLGKFLILPIFQDGGIDQPQGHSF